MQSAGGGREPFKSLHIHRLELHSAVLSVVVVGMAGANPSYRGVLLLLLHRGQVGSLL